MDVQSLFGDVSVASFAADYLHRLPFSLAGTTSGVTELGTWEALDAILPVAGGDAFAVRDGKWYVGEMPRSATAAQGLESEGYTIFVRHAELHHAGLAELAAAFERTFVGPVNIHVFATPAGSPGFSWHYDAEDVFIIQTSGEKEYSLRKNTVNPWPLEESLPADMQYEREIMPLMRVLLRAGDLLYIPCGYWHKASAADTGETAISLAVGVMSRSAMEVYEYLRPRLVESLAWRQRLPPAGPSSPLSPDALKETYSHIFQQLANDLAKTLGDPRFAVDFIASLSHPPENAATEQGNQK